MYYFYRKSNRGHGFCPLYRGCLPFGESVIRGFTVHVHMYTFGLDTCSQFLCAYLSVQLGHEAYRPGTVAYAKIIEEFGEGKSSVVTHA